MAEEQTETKENLFSVSIGTVYRIGKIFDLIDYFFSTQDYQNVFTQIILCYNNHHPFMKEEDRIKCDKYEDDLKKSKAKCFINTKQGVTFKPSEEFVEKLIYFDRILKDLSYKYGVYMKTMTDDSNISLLQRKPRLNYF